MLTQFVVDTVRGRIAQHGVDLTVPLPIIEHAEALTADLPEDQQASLRDLAAALRMTAGEMLSYAHREDTTHLPSGKELDDLRAAANRAVFLINEADPTFVQDQIARSSKRHQQLLRSMLVRLWPPREDPLRHEVDRERGVTLAQMDRDGWVDYRAVVVFEDDRVSVDFPMVGLGRMARPSEDELRRISAAGRDVAETFVDHQDGETEGELGRSMIDAMAMRPINRLADGALFACTVMNAYLTIGRPAVNDALLRWLTNPSEVGRSLLDDQLPFGFWLAERPPRAPHLPPYAGPLPHVDLSLRIVEGKASFDQRTFESGSIGSDQALAVSTIALLKHLVQKFALRHGGNTLDDDYVGLLLAHSKSLSDMYADNDLAQWNYVEVAYKLSYAWVYEADDEPDDS